MRGNRGHNRQLGRLIDRNQLGYRNRQARDGSMTRQQCRTSVPEKSTGERGWRCRQIQITQPFSLRIEQFRSWRMHVVPTSKASMIPIEMRPNVKQLVENRHQFFAIRQIQKPRQTKREDVQLFTSVNNQGLDHVPLSTSHAQPRATLEPQRCQLGPEPRSSTTARASDADQHIPHHDVRQLGDPARNILAQVTHLTAKIKVNPVSRINNIAAGRQQSNLTGRRTTSRPLRSRHSLRLLPQAEPRQRLRLRLL